MMYRVLIYRGTLNLGDAIQAYAMARLLPAPLIGIYRDKAHEAVRPNPAFVVNGWLGDRVPDLANTLFAGVHIGRRPDEQLKWLKQSSFRVGARDPHTQEVFRAAGIESDMIGCATLTFPRYFGPRRGVLNIEGFPSFSKDVLSLTNYVNYDVPWRRQWELAESRLMQIRSAHCVHTTRLHIILPCLAFGTPVVVPRREISRRHDRHRFSILDSMRFEYDKPFTTNVRPIAHRFARFLEEELKTSVVPNDSPEMPTPEDEMRGSVGPSYDSHQPMSVSPPGDESPV